MQPGSEHAVARSFLRYRNACIHFIYSFAWDPHHAPWKALCEDLATKGWRTRRLHERTLDGQPGRDGPTYQPSLVPRTIVLEKAGTISPRAVVRAPIEPYSGKTLPRCEEIPVRLEYVARILDNGGGTFTIAAYISADHASFETIHQVLRLAANVDRGGVTEAEAQKHDHLTASFIALDFARDSHSDLSLVPTRAEHSLTYESGYFTLHDLYRRLLTDTAVPWTPATSAAFWCDLDVLETDNLHQDFQAPFVLTAAEVDAEDMQRLRKECSHIAEVASIACKLTLDNRHIARDYRQLSPDYLQQALPATCDGGLANLCMDQRLFFTTSRRGAIALAEKLSEIPAYFVVPSFLNLLEILRSRWHVCNVIGARVDGTIAAIQSEADLPPDDLLLKNYRWRAVYGTFLRNPIPFLFDGGSVTDIAEFAQRQQWLPELERVTERKLQCLDQLIQDQIALGRWRLMREAEAEESQETE